MADPIDILSGRPSAKGDEWTGTLANIAQVLASIPERRARAAQQRIEMEGAQLKLQSAQQQAADLQALDAAFAQPGGRDKVLSQIPGHLRGKVAQQFAELDESNAKRQEAREKARQAADDTIARGLTVVKSHDYDPLFAQGTISTLKTYYQDDPDRLKELQLVEAAIHENPTRDHVRMITDALIARSPTQRKAENEAAKAALDQEAAQQKIAGTEPIQPVEQARIDAENERADAMRAAQETGQAETARNNAFNNRIAQLNAESNRMRALKTGAAGATKPRGVTSGDANRLAEMQTGLNDLEQLAGKIGKTGAGSQIGAALPNFVTEMTGVGADSKSRQAVIDTIKQIIGKSLEGGVLRKEDEIKYEKILPRIGDPPAVATSKIEGLKQTIGQKRQDLMSALDDAGYDVSRFKAREAEPVEEWVRDPKTGRMVKK